MGFIGARGLGTRSHEPGRGGCQKMDHRAQFHEDAAHCREGAKACQPNERRPADICIPYFAKFLRIKTFEPFLDLLVIGRTRREVCRSGTFEQRFFARTRPAFGVLELFPDIQRQGGGFSYESTTPRSESRDQRLPGPSQSPRPIQSFEREVGRLKSESGVRRYHPDIRRQPACRRTSRRRGVVTSMLVESVLQPEVRVPDRPRLERAGTPDRRSPRPCCDRSRWSTRRVTAVGLGRDR